MVHRRLWHLSSFLKTYRSRQRNLWLQVNFLWNRFEMTKEAAVGCGLYGASRIRIPTILEGIKLLGLVASICYGRSFLT